MLTFTKSLCKKFLITFLSIFLVSAFAFAENIADPDFPTSNVPLDGGLSLLLVAGAAYGGRKVYQYRNAKNK